MNFVFCVNCESLNEHSNNYKQCYSFTRFQPHFPHPQIQISRRRFWGRNQICTNFLWPVIFWHGNGVKSLTFRASSQINGDPWFEGLVNEVWNFSINGKNLEFLRTLRCLLVNFAKNQQQRFFKAKNLYSIEIESLCPTCTPTNYLNFIDENIMNSTSANGFHILTVLHHHSILAASRKLNCSFAFSSVSKFVDW